MSLQLFSTVKARNVSLARRLLKQGANVNEVNGVGLTPLIVASANDYAEMAEFPVKKAGASVNMGDNKAINDGATPLFMSAQNGHQEVVRLLLVNGTKADQAMNDGRTTLFISKEN